MSQNSKSADKSSPAKPKLILGVITAALIVLWLLSSLGGGGGMSESFYVVKRGDFLVSVNAGGTLEAVNQEVIRNEVDGNSRVIYIIPEGTVVKEGELLVELDSAEAEEQLNQQKLSYEKAVQEVEAAKANLQIEQSQVQSQIDAAILSTNFAYIDYKKFVEGDKLQQLRNAEISIQTTEESLKIAQDRLFWSQRLFKEGFETKTKLEQDQLSVTNSLLSLEQSRTELTMLQNYDLPKLEEQYVSDLIEASNQLSRVILQSTNSLNKAISDLITQSNSLILNKERLDKETEQLDKSKIYAPIGGMVVYAKSRSRFSSESMIEEGATVRKRQDLITLPDTSQMKVDIKVHESQVNKVKKGQTAFVVLDSMPDERFKGIVSKVAPLPDSASFFSDPNLKEYRTEILVTDPLPDLKPGVSARAEIVITNIANTLKVPIQSVTTVNSQQVVYKSSIGDPERTPVQVGLFNTKFIQILKGVGEDDRILLAPPLKMEEVDLAGEIFDDGEKMSDSDLKPDTKALEKLKPKAGERGGRPQMQGGPAGQRGQGKQGGQGGGSFNREAMMKRFDTNGDGKVSDEERAAAIKQFQKSQGGGGAPGGK
ncbi:MAG: HlyD family efflux transporter periplasmic adaptor subunit [Verrucomicrobia bacterium]|jgi:HlyD family secretion protein|nr:HlyD family efflux transporter periplasmic adaptor subunit [Verrucomicrobiota bacterium]MBT4275980.1 HlyD family efflux transporter periplasmic adaptor subunit [Verrucomicrobiota bacterium]MBT5062547.1 HlyD family efflux transporter periplasmic adaptor subunit [Verrucomicrobiota bacterium]MBT5480318.1 HlyD family efflux transporter periplasmic adaptor subunit [Verrucomicrobiota bacterium]MBT6805473.1 HlyD family efflux transporter periplasmic adaptor subunit [Verrucomicrobiota bacterium]